MTSLKFLRIALFYGLLGILSTFAAQAEEIRTYNGLTRPDVPKLRLYVLKMPELKTLVDKDSPINVTATLQQVPNSFYFRAVDSRKNEAYYKLDSHLDFQPVDSKSVPNLAKEIRALHNYRAEATLEDPSIVTIYDNNNVVGKFTAPLPYSRNSDWTSVRDFLFFNGGRSMAFSERGQLYVVKDIAHPQVTNYYDLAGYPMFGDLSAGFFFTVQFKGKDYFLNRIDAISGKVRKHFASFSSKTTTDSRWGFENFKFDPNSGRIVVTARQTSGLDSLIIDADSGKVLATFKLIDDRASASMNFLGKGGGRHMVLIGDEIIDLQSGKELAILPGLFAISARTLSKDGHSLLYATKKDDRTFEMTKLINFDLVNLKIAGSVILPAPPQTNAPPAALREMVFTPDGNLMITAGTQGYYSDHIHLQ